jgi:hypothetical protein
MTVAFLITSAPLRAATVLACTVSLGRGGSGRSADEPRPGAMALLAPDASILRRLFFTGSKGEELEGYEALRF